MLYRVEVREVHVQAYVVEANSKVEAKIKVEGGGGEIDEAHFVYSHTLDPDTWTVEEEKNPDIWTVEEENNTIIGYRLCAPILRTTYLMARTQICRMFRPLWYFRLKKRK